jgi:TetR/AcrR family transcriptional regulator of autoinduction and epiphytic fitness
MRVQLDGEMPSLPSQNSSLRAALMADMAYLGQLMAVSERLGNWITEAQSQGQITTAVPAEVVLYTLFARACDPVLGVLKAGGHAPDQVIAWVMATTFGGLATR